MFLTITGKCPNVDRKTLKKAIAFYADYLMSNHEKVNLCVEFQKNLHKNEKDEAYCVQEDKNTYNITIDPKFGKRKLLITLAHEMVHLKQYVNGELKHLARKKLDKFCGNDYPENMFYWEQPWEIEAYGRELGLYRMFIMDLKK